MADDIEKVSLGEVYRAVLRVEKLAQDTNGRVDGAEKDIAVLTERVDGLAPRANGGLVGGALAIIGIAGELIWRMVSSK